MSTPTSKSPEVKVAKSAKQIAFASLSDHKNTEFGGDLLKGNHPKFKRPLSSKKAIHLVMRSTKARGAHSFLRFHLAIKRIIDNQARRHGIQVYRLANAGNHLHLMIRCCSRRAYTRFIRSISGLIARLVLQKERGCSRAPREDHGAQGSSRTQALKTYNRRRVQFDCARQLEPKEKKTRFWDLRPYSRLISWGRDFKLVSHYLLKNTLEALKVIPYQARGTDFARGNSGTNSPSARRGNTAKGRGFSNARRGKTLAVI